MTTIGNILSIDIGGTGIKSLCVDSERNELVERYRLLTPKPAHPEPVLGVVEQLIERAREELGDRQFDYVAVGFPGVVMGGVVKTAPNLGTEAWAGFDLASAIEKIAGKPTRAINDADLQGFGVIEKKGVELVLTLGTGLGTGLYTEGHLVSNLELGHHPFEEGHTYEERVSDAALKEVGATDWSARVHRMLATMQPIFNPDVIHMGGWNTRLIQGDLPDNVHVFDNAEGMVGGVALWESVVGR